MAFLAVIFDTATVYKSLVVHSCYYCFSTLFYTVNTVDMVLQDLGRRINAAVNDLTRSNNLDEKVSSTQLLWWDRC